jgi:hypothetical protein
MDHVGVGGHGQATVMRPVEQGSGARQFLPCTSSKGKESTGRGGRGRCAAMAGGGGAGEGRGGWCHGERMGPVSRWGGGGTAGRAD